MSEGYKPEAEVLDDEAGRMTLEEAQTEANLIKALLTTERDNRNPFDDEYETTAESGILRSPKGGPTLDKFKVHHSSYEAPSAQDYEEALRSLEKLVKLTQDPTLSEKGKIIALNLVIAAFEYFWAWPKFMIGAPLKVLATLTGYNPEIVKIQEKAKKAMEQLESDGRHTALIESMKLEEEADQRDRDARRKAREEVA